MKRELNMLLKVVINSVEYTYLLLIEFEVCTVKYGPSFFRSSASRFVISPVFFLTIPRVEMKRELNMLLKVVINSVEYTYLLLIEFEVCTVKYGPSFFPSIYGPSAKARAINRWEKTRIRILQYGPRERG